MVAVLPVIARAAAEGTARKKGTEVKVIAGRRKAATAMVEKALAGTTDSEAKCFGGLVLRDLSSSSFHKLRQQLPKSKKQLAFVERARKNNEKRSQEMTVRRHSMGKLWCLPPKRCVATAQPVPLTYPAVCRWFRCALQRDSELTALHQCLRDRPCTPQFGSRMSSLFPT